MKPPPSSFVGWAAALNLLAETASPQAPSVVVLDELPYLLESEPGFEAVLQEVRDRRMESRPVLLILIGPDLRIMKALAFESLNCPAEIGFYRK